MPTSSTDFLSPRLRSGLRSGLPALLAVTLLGLSARAGELDAIERCARPVDPRDDSAAVFDTGPAVATASRAEPEDVNEVDADPLDAVPMALDPAMPPQELAALLQRAMQQGDLVVLLLPKP